ncbi:MAG: hypothetical protein KGY74_11345, partial [Candidatus Cloacimonetes bacterium]|nr:hypothetical protein [Candidatus Cloacimonadota bacterium]
HFHFNLEPEIIDNKIFLNEKLFMELSLHAHITKEDYRHAHGFNILKNAKQLKVEFIDTLLTEMYC